MGKLDMSLKWKIRILAHTNADTLHQIVEFCF